MLTTGLTSDCIWQVLMNQEERGGPADREGKGAALR